MSLLRVVIALPIRTHGRRNEKKTDKASQTSDPDWGRPCVGHGCHGAARARLLRERAREEQAVLRHHYAEEKKRQLQQQQQSFKEILREMLTGHAGQTDWGKWKADTTHEKDPSSPKPRYVPPCTNSCLTGIIKGSTIIPLKDC